MRVLALLDGTLLDPDGCHIRVDDLGLLRGDGVFETVLVVDGRPRELGPHLRRLARSARMLDLPAPDLAAWERTCGLVVDEWPAAGEMALKLVYTRGPEFGDGSTTAYVLGLPITESQLAARVSGVSAVTLARGFDPAIAAAAPWLLLGAKTLSYAVNMAASRHANALGADDVIFTAADGTVLEGPMSTAVVVQGRVLRTTPPSSGVLEGTTQGALFRAAERAGWTTRVEAIPVADLWTADAVFLASSVRKITQVRVLDGVELTHQPDLHAELMALHESEYV
ncbi:aminodeoxychorismate lyase [Actinokineospora pegani]|uniref:aminodeoxychorismate lyase n=1 Tax=Actinokineospora pegani TaxID=2654637 RepID=UPI0012E9D98B|nr:aminodeoxychorismate lyase [Actinokineospora pegani]